MKDQTGTSDSRNTQPFGVKRRSGRPLGTKRHQPPLTLSANTFMSERLYSRNLLLFIVFVLIVVVCLLLKRQNAQMSRDIGGILGFKVGTLQEGFCCKTKATVQPFCQSTIVTSGVLIQRCEARKL